MSVTRAVGPPGRWTLPGLTPVAESDQFAIYAQGDDTYLLVQRHNGTPWTAVRLSGDGLFRVGALLVDAIQGQRQVVIKSLEANYRHVPGIAAATILGDGRVALILDVDAVVASSRNDAAFYEPILATVD